MVYSTAQKYELKADTQLDSQNMILVFENVNSLNFETKELSSNSLMSSFKKTGFF